MTAACALTGFPAHAQLVAASTFTVIEDPNKAADALPTEPPPPTLVSIRGAVGAPNVRALCAAILARGTGLSPIPYTPIKRLELLDAGAGDSGAASVADVLNNGALMGVALESVSLVRCGVGPEGAATLGNALMLGGNTSLLSLSLDCNLLGDVGTRLLCRGLLTNRSLKRLSLASVGMGESGAFEIASYINSSLCVLEALDLSGNNIGVAGLQSLSVSALYSKTLVELTLCNCGLSSRRQETLIAADLALAIATGGSDAIASATAAAAATATTTTDTLTTNAVATAAAAAVVVVTAAAFDALGRALASTDCALGSVDLDGNPMNEADAAALIPYLTAPPPKVTKLIVPKTLKSETFIALFRNVVAKAKKGGKAKK